MLVRTDTPPGNKSDNSKPRDVVAANGGALELGHLIGASRLSVSNVLPERELSVEAVMKTASEILWPEPSHAHPTQLDDMERARARAFTLPTRAQVPNREDT